MDIIFVRHGETYDNLEKRFSRESTTLNEKGVSQIKDTRIRLMGYDYSRVYVSPLKRTKQTLYHLGLDAIEEDRIREMNFGIFTGQTFKEYQSKYPVETQMWIDDSINYTIPEGESIMDTYKRVESFLNELLAKNENAVVVTHEGIIRLACSWVIGSVDHFFRFRADNGSITVISANEEYRFIKGLNIR